MASALPPPRATSLVGHGWDYWCGGFFPDALPTTAALPPHMHKEKVDEMIDAYMSSLYTTAVDGIRDFWCWYLWLCDAWYYAHASTFLLPLLLSRVTLMIRFDDAFIAAVGPERAASVYTGSFHDFSVAPLLLNIRGFSDDAPAIYSGSRRFSLAISFLASQASFPLFDFVVKFRLAVSFSDCYASASRFISSPCRPARAVLPLGHRHCLALARRFRLTSLPHVSARLHAMLYFRW